MIHHTAPRERRPPAGPNNRLRDDRGFSLVEMLITMVVMSLVTASLISLLIGQGRFYRHSDDTIFTQQTARAVMDLMSAELRLAGADDVLAAVPDSVAVRFDVQRSVVCDTTAADEAILFAYDSVQAVNLSGLAGGFSGVSYSQPYATNYEYADGWAGTTVNTGAVPKAICTANGAPGTAPDANYMTVSGWGGNFASGVPDRGSLVRGYGRLAYRLAPSGFSTGTALFRGPQELVAPFQAGASFSYVMDDASVRTSVISADLDDIRAIRLTAVALGDASAATGVSRSFQFDIPLRN